MGYNPFRVRVKHRGDVVIVAAAIVVVVALVAWALFGF
jgi:chorismate synthase